MKCIETFHILGAFLIVCVWSDGGGFAFTCIKINFTANLLEISYFCVVHIFVQYTVKHMCFISTHTHISNNMLIKFTRRCEPFLARSLLLYYSLCEYMIWNLFLLYYILRTYIKKIEISKSFLSACGFQRNVFRAFFFRLHGI